MNREHWKKIEALRRCLGRWFDQHDGHQGLEVPPGEGASPRHGLSGLLANLRREKLPQVLHQRLRVLQPTQLPCCFHRRSSWLVMRVGLVPRPSCRRTAIFSPPRTTGCLRQQFCSVPIVTTKLEPQLFLTLGCTHSKSHRLSSILAQSLFQLTDSSLGSRAPRPPPPAPQLRPSLAPPPRPAPQLRPSPAPPPRRPRLSFGRRPRLRLGLVLWFRRPARY